MSNDKQLVLKDSSDLALNKTKSLLNITDKILANKTLAVNDDAWVNEFIAWAKKNKISNNTLSLNKQSLLELTFLNLSDNQLTEVPDFIGNLFVRFKVKTTAF